MSFDLNKIRIGVIGLGYVGLPLAVEFGRKYRTTGFDIKSARINELRQGKDSTLEVSDEELGAALVTGPLLGTVGIVWITQSLQFLEEYRMIIFGPLLVLLVIFFPRGIAGSFLTWMHHKSQALAPGKKRQESKVGTAQDREAQSNA